jgi:hypothetical protein
VNGLKENRNKGFCEVPNDMRGPVGFVVTRKVALATARVLSIVRGKG